ncbi:hypothetical protein NKH77_28670 [Streptomyces sp. M19]
MATGTAGSTYRFLLHAARMNAQWNLGLDLGLIRAGMMAISLSVGHHTFHEVMRGAQLALDDVPDHDTALDYKDSWDRYANFYPLSEQELRENVAHDGLFPDEHAQALLDEIDPTSTIGHGGQVRLRSPGPAASPPSPCPACPSPGSSRALEPPTARPPRASGTPTPGPPRTAPSRFATRSATPATSGSPTAR